MRVSPPFDVFTDVYGDPLESGHIYVGQAGLNPEASPISAYFDEALTVPAAQNGAPAKLFAAGSGYSITVRDKNGLLVYSSLQTESPVGVSDVAIQRDTVDAMVEDTALSAGQLVRTKGYTTAGDGGQASYLIKSAADFGGTPDGYGDHLLANGNVAVLQVEGFLVVEQYGAKGDGVTDDKLAIQAACDAATTGDSIKFLNTQRATSYVISGQVTITVQGVTLFSDSAGERARITVSGSGFTMFKVERGLFGMKGIQLEGDGVASGGTITTQPTTVAVEIDNTITGDSDSRFFECSFLNHTDCLINRGPNVEVDTCLFGGGRHAFVQRLSGLKESRDIRIHDCRFHVVGYNSTDAFVADSTCIRIEDGESFGIQVNDNKADNCKKFFQGPPHILNVSDNQVLGAELDIINIVKTGTTADRWTVSGNVLAGLSGPTSLNVTGIVVDGSAQAIQYGNIVGNHISTVTRDGINLNNCNKSNITNNLIQNPNSSGPVDGSSGIIGVNSDDNTFLGNYVVNSAANNLLAGISLDAASTGNSLINNKLSGNMTDDLAIADGGTAIIDTNGGEVSIYQPSVGNAELLMDANNANGDRATYARLRTQVSSSAAGGEKGNLIGDGGNSGGFNIGFRVNEDGDFVSTAATAAPADSYLHNGSISFYLEEGTNTLKYKVKESSGTVLTGTVGIYA